MGRPTVYTDEAAEEILRRLAEGESLTRICKDDHLPSRITVNRWKRAEGGAPESFWIDYEKAREDQAEAYFHEVLDLADALEGDGVAVSSEVTNARRLRIDSRKWVLARMDRGKYGDRAAVDLGGQDGAEIKFSWRSEPEPQESPDVGD